MEGGGATIEQDKEFRDDNDDIKTATMVTMNYFSCEVVGLVVDSTVLLPATNQKAKSSPQQQVAIPATTGVTLRNNGEVNPTTTTDDTLRRRRRRRISRVPMRLTLQRETISCVCF